MTFLGVMRKMHEAAWLVLALCTPLPANALIAVPAPEGHVTDQTGTLTQVQKFALEQTLTAFEARKGTQLVVLIVAATAPEAIEQYALRVAEQWKPGRKKVDDGVILLVAKEDRTMRIEVGYGLEGVLSDVVSKRIISETILPRFKQGDFYGGVQAGTEQIIQVVDGEPLAPPAVIERGANGHLSQLLPFLFIATLGVGGVFRGMFGKVGGSLITGVVVTGLTWLMIGTVLYAVLAGLASLFLTLIGAGTLMHGLGVYSSEGRGGSGGGGFRGGGGGFGGGGASGRW
jgi:uncharacterized protein